MAISATQPVTAQTFVQDRKANIGQATPADKRAQQREQQDKLAELQGADGRSALEKHLSTDEGGQLLNIQA